MTKKNGDDYNQIMSNRNVFNKFVYTPLSEALNILEKRRNNPELVKKIETLLQGNIPEFFKVHDKCGVLGRHIATPNHESEMFIKIAKELKLFPVFFEYYDDKFTSNNAYKHSLGQLQVQHTKGVTEKGDHRFEKINIVDFNEYNGKMLREVKTLWDEPLIDFHQRLFKIHSYGPKDYLCYDGSSWFKENGGQKAADFYTNFLCLFTCYGILFENFLTSEDEDGDFTRNIVLPALAKATELTGIKPLITPLGPLEIETDPLWFHHLPKVKKIIPNLKKND